MRKIVALEYLTLDGVMEHPAWTAPYFNDEHARYAHAQLFGADALLLGRETYEGFAQAWPQSTDEQGFADRMNSLPKYVVTDSPGELSWTNSQRIAGAELAARLADFKAQPGQDILIYGSGKLVRSLMAQGLLDVLRLWVHPVVVGVGKRLFADGETATLTLLDTERFSSGTVVLSYAPEKP